MRRETKGGLNNFLLNIKNLKLLLNVYSSIQNAIISSESINTETGTPIKNFTTENIVGEYAELLICERLGLIQQPTSNRDYDAIDDDGCRYQIKSRWIGHGSGSGKTEMGPIKDSTLNAIDFIICLLFNRDFSVKYAFKIPANFFNEYADRKANTWILKLNQRKVSRLSNNNSIDDLRDLLNG